MSTSNDYRTPLFFINGELLADGSVPPDKLQPGIPGSLLQDGSVPPGKLQSGIPGSLLQNGSVPPGKLQSGIPGSLLQNGSVPLQALAPEVASRLRLPHSAPFATYPDSSINIYGLVNAYRAWAITNGDTIVDNTLIVVPVILSRSLSLGTVSVICNSLTFSGTLYIGLYNDSGTLLATAVRTVASTGLLSTSFSPTINLQANTVYYLGFLKTGGLFTMSTVNYLSLEYAWLSGNNLNLVGVMRFSATSLPSSLNGLTLTAEGGYRAPALLF